MIAELVTERLRLRAFRIDDFAAFASLWADPEVARHITGEPRSRQESWRSFLGIAGGWALAGFGPWALEEKSSGRLIGQVGFFRAERGFGPDFDESPECGWVLSRIAWGRGLGQEAVDAAHRWFDRQPFGERSVAMIESGHAASRKVAERAGYRLFRSTEYGGSEIELFERMRGTEFSV